MVLKQACSECTTWKAISKLQSIFRPPSSEIAHSFFRWCPHWALRVFSKPAGTEITETVLLQDTEMVLEALHQLRELGVRISRMILERAIRR
jgi:EAL domain-containing protein (putative c-di-GMP-specific phosphodiesterase class I)